jgi:hypothetical protein
MSKLPAIICSTEASKVSGDRFSCVYVCHLTIFFPGHEEQTTGERGSLVRTVTGTAEDFRALERVSGTLVEFSA